jgi:hypothetical protein
VNNGDQTVTVTFSELVTPTSTGQDTALQFWSATDQAWETGTWASTTPGTTQVMNFVSSAADYTLLAIVSQFKNAVAADPLTVVSPITPTT